MTSKPAELGKLERPVKMDYSVTYRENDRLAEGLDKQLITLKRSAQRVMTGKEGELETARVDADKILRLKEAVNNKQEEEPALAILCKSVMAFRRTSSAMSSSSKRRTSSVNNGINRRISAVSSARDSVDEQDGSFEENGDMDYSLLPSGPLPDMKKMSITERRLAKERERFSAKNLFNVRRTNNTHTLVMDSPRRADTSLDNFRTPTPTSQPNQPNSKREGRPKTSPAAYNRRGHSTQTSRGYLRPTTASSSRLVTFMDDGDEDGFSRAPRRPRSRRELQKLSELKIDPFGDDDSKSDSGSSSGNLHQDLLHSLHVGQAQLQDRVSSFLKTMEDFNKRQRKSGLEQILEAT